MAQDFKTYLEFRQSLLEAGRSNSSDDDVLDQIVDVTCERVHFNDQQLNTLLAVYRGFEQDWPEYVQRADRLIPVV